MVLDIKLLKQFVPFSELADEYLVDAIEHIKLRDFAKGDMLFKRGRAAAEKYFLLDGRVDLIDASYTAVSFEAGREGTQSTLNPESPTRASCIAKSPVKAFVIEAESLDRIVAWSQSAASANEEGEQTIEVGEVVEDDAGDWMSSLLQSPLFSKIPLTQVQELFLRFESVPLTTGDLVIKEGERGDYFYVLASGNAKVFNHSNSVDITLEPGSYFGEEALLGNTPRNASIEMLTNGAVKRLNAEDFTALLKAPVLKYVENKLLDTLDKPYKLIDVKMPMEFRIQHVPGSINLPLSRLRSSIGELARENVYIVPDDAGSRADIAAHILCQAGFDALILKAEAAGESS